MAGLRWPVAGHDTTQGFAGTNRFESAGFLARDGNLPRIARRAQFTGGVAQDHLHGAIDIGCPVGTQIVAPEAGRVVAASHYDSTGEQYLMLEIRPGVILFFTHLSEFSAAVGERVARGDEIARSGNTGMSTGPHLHWEVRITTHPDPDFRRSRRWFKWNPERLGVGGDLAALSAIVPPGVAAAAAAAGAPVDPASPPAAPAVAESDPANPNDEPPDELPDEPGTDVPDTVGDEAALLDHGPELVDHSGDLQGF